MIKTRAGVCWMLLAGGTRGSLFVDFSTAEGAPALCLAFFEDFFITFVFFFPVVFNRHTPLHSDVIASGLTYLPFVSS